MSVVACSNAAEALDAFAKGAFDVIVSDISMPQLTGLDLLRAVRAWDLEIPVILVTGAPSLASAVEAVELGAHKYLQKPIDNAELIGSVLRAARLYRLARAKAEAIRVLGTPGGRTSDKIGLRAALDRAIESLWPAYQPIVSAKDRTLFGYEALMRSDDSALPDPGSILDAAERVGVLDIVGRTMRERACQGFLGVSDDLCLFLNLHPQDLLDPELENPHSVVGRLASRVVLEVTERTTLDKVPKVKDRVAKLQARGFRIAIDDLGAGYAGLVSFVQLEPDFVKLDMSLIRDIDSSTVKQRLVGSMTRVSQDLGLLVAAEGIETEAERDATIDLGVDLLQGFRFGRPEREPQTPTW
jgi:EAL domain-containing protein (putative c-di-GMP-specific phosphodiesterase class I)